MQNDYRRDYYWGNNYTSEVSFEGETKLHGLNIYLTFARYLQKLKLKNISLIPDPSNATRTPPVIILPLLRELYFYGSPYLSNDEYFLLSWITKYVTILRLESFTFTGDIRFKTRKRHNSSRREVKDFSKDPYSILRSFLLRNGSYLKKLTISGVNLAQGRIQKSIPWEKSPPTTVNLSRVSSVSISLDIQELKTLVKDLVELEHLTWDRFVVYRPEHASRFASLLACLENNWRTLRDIEITPTILAPEISHEILELFQINCDIFQVCSVVQTLRLRMNFMTDPESWHYAIPGRVRNIHSLPFSLRFFEIWTEGFDKTDLDLFEDRFEGFVNLRAFQLTCPTYYPPFTISNSFVRKMQGSDVRSAVFIGGRLENAQDTSQLTHATSYDGKLALTLMDSNRICFDRKGNFNDSM